MHDELRAVSYAVSHETLRKRIQRGWCPDRARTVPARKRDEVALEKRLERRTLRDLASAHVTSIYAARLSLWANWRGPVSNSPLIASLSPCGRPPIAAFSGPTESAMRDLLGDEIGNVVKLPAQARERLSPFYCSACAATHSTKCRRCGARHCGNRGNCFEAECEKCEALRCKLVEVGPA